MSNNININIFTGRTHADSHQNEDQYVNFDSNNIDEIKQLILNLSAAVRYTNNNYKAMHIINDCIKKAKNVEHINYDEISQL